MRDREGRQMHTVGRRRFFVLGMCCALSLARHDALSARPRQTPAAFRWPTGRAAVSLSFDDARTSQVDHGLVALKSIAAKFTSCVLPRLSENPEEVWSQPVADGPQRAAH